MESLQKKQKANKCSWFYVKLKVFSTYSIFAFQDLVTKLVCFYYECYFIQILSFPFHLVK